MVAVDNHIEDNHVDKEICSTDHCSCSYLLGELLFVWTNPMHDERIRWNWRRYFLGIVGNVGGTKIPD